MASKESRAWLSALPIVVYLLLSYGHVTEELSELNGSCDSWVHVRVESGLFANEIEKSSLEIQYRRLKSLTWSTEPDLRGEISIEVDRTLVRYRRCADRRQTRVTRVIERE